MKEKKDLTETTNESLSQITGFTFFISYYNAACTLGTDAEIAAFFMGLCKYAFSGKAPDLTGPAAGMFELAKPNIDVSIKKALAGAKGGKAKKSVGVNVANAKQNGSKTEANAKQNGSDKDIGNGNNKDSGEGDVNKVGDTDVDKAFEAFWNAYPRKSGKLAAQEKYRNALETGVTARFLLEALNKQKASKQWLEADGKFIPNPAKWLEEGRWNDVIGGNNNGENHKENDYEFENPVLAKLYKGEKSGSYASGSELG